tara:strand:- start:2491 stop:3003 length:513 start_codon:yes stop_codon:yes gene_type:complete
MNKPQRLSGIVKKISDPVFGRKSMLYGQLIANWPQIAGEDMASYAFPAELKFLRKAGRQNSAVLKLSVTSARAQDVLMQKDLLIEKLNQFMGFNSIEDIQLQHRPHQAIRNQIERQAIRPRPLAKEQKEEISRQIDKTQDANLKEALEALGNAVYCKANSNKQIGNQDEN